MRLSRSLVELVNVELRIRVIVQNKRSTPIAVQHVFSMAPSILALNLI